jgi:hypothetical protein
MTDHDQPPTLDRRRHRRLHPSGKRIYRRGSGRTKTESKNKLKEVLRDHEDGVAISPTHIVLADVVTDWLAYELTTQSASTRDNYMNLATARIIPALGAGMMRDLRAEDVDRWLAEKPTTLSTRTLRLLHSMLNRAVTRAMARDKVKRNVVQLCSIPKSQPGRPSKALTRQPRRAIMHASDVQPSNNIRSPVAVAHLHSCA